MWPLRLFIQNNNWCGIKENDHCPLLVFIYNDRLLHTSDFSFRFTTVNQSFFSFAAFRSKSGKLTVWFVSVVKRVSQVSADSLWKASWFVVLRIKVAESSKNVVEQGYLSHLDNDLNSMPSGQNYFLANAVSLGLYCWTRCMPMLLSGFYWLEVVYVGCLRLKWSF